MHVGSCIPRKRIDLLLEIVAAVRRLRPEARLVKAGGNWTAAQRQQIDRLGLGGVVEHRPNLSRPALAELYRSAELVLVPSEQEGFGIPVIEALACGTPVLASDLPTLREAGGEAAHYLPVGDVAAWSDFVIAALERNVPLAPREARKAQAARFTWESHARIIADAYCRLAAEAS
jgi:glycosyltransferase involved in cell wall biosynthesis